MLVIVWFVVITMTLVEILLIVKVIVLMWEILKALVINTLLALVISIINV